MSSVRVSLTGSAADISYDILVESGLLDRTGALVADVIDTRRKLAIITDTTVGPIYGEKVQSSLASAGFTTSLHAVPAGEASKSMAQCGALCDELIRAGHDRSSAVIALGGGVVGDLAGFVAAIFYRGIPFVQIPTTIVSLVDSAVGGKTAVNSPEGKNLIGAFLQPRLVIADPATLTTLSPREFREGFAEAIKHAAIRDAAMLDDLLAHDPRNQIVDAALIARNIAIKARVVEDDEKELTGTRALLNFGHTIGHGIEASVPYGTLLHGEAISLGCRAALYLSEKRSTLSADDSARILSAFAHYQLPLQLPDDIATDTIVAKLKTDKKFAGGQIRFVLLDRLGAAHLSDKVTLDDIIEAIEHLRTAPAS